MNPGLWTREGSWHRESHKIPLPYPSPGPAVGRGSSVSESQRHLTRRHVLSHMLFWLYVLPIELDWPLVDIGVSLHFLTICCLGGRKVLWEPEEKQPRLDVLHRCPRNRVTDDGLPTATLHSGTASSESEPGSRVLPALDTGNIIQFKKEGNFDTWHIVEPWGHCADWNKLVIKRQILYDSTCIKHLLLSNFKSKKWNVGCQGLGEREGRISV